MSAAVAAAIAALARPAGASCRTTTCEACARDPATGCLLGGIPIVWPERCVGYGLQPDVPPALGYEAVRAAVEASFATWQNVICPTTGEPPSISLSDAFGPVGCPRHEYNQDQPNANVVVFRTESLSESTEPDTLALTTVTYGTETGHILDVDMEIDGTRPLSVGSSTVGGHGYDLQWIVTHEVGHFLGLDHSAIRTSTMHGSYPLDPLDLRHLAADDIAGICAIYPPDRSTPACDFRPHGGFSAECALDPVAGGRCSAAPGREAARSGAAGTMGCLLAGAIGRRRGRRRQKTA